jgi:hypothetical protein
VHRARASIKMPGVELPATRPFVGRTILADPDHPA